MSVASFLQPDMDDSCCSCPETPCADCNGCEEAPDTISAVLSGFSAMGGCLDPGNGQYIEVTSAALDGSYVLSGGGGEWYYTGSEDYVEAELYGTVSTCATADPPVESVNSLTISVTCAGGVMTLALTVAGDTLTQVNYGSGGPPIENPVTIGTTTDEANLSFLEAGSVTLSWA